MKFCLPAAVSVLLLALAGCATFPPAQLSQMQANGVPPALVAKLQSHRPITPPEIIVLTRKGVPETSLVKYIERNGVNYVLNHADAVSMREAGVGVRVIDAVDEEGRYFARNFHTDYHRFSADVSYGDPYVNFPDSNGFEW